MYLLIKYICLSHGGIGEGVNTVDCGSIMHRFESDIPPQNGKKSKDFKIKIDSYESIFLLLERNW